MVVTVALTDREQAALLEVLQDAELYVEDGRGGGWVSPATHTDVLLPLIGRLEADVVPARRITVGLAVELPDEAPCTPADVAAEVLAALEVGTDPAETPALGIGRVTVTGYREQASSRGGAFS